MSRLNVFILSAIAKYRKIICPGRRISIVSGNKKLQPQESFVWWTYIISGSAKYRSGIFVDRNLDRNDVNYYIEAGKNA